MPIVSRDGEPAIEYHIPDEIKQRIPDYFYIAFGGELVSVFGLSVFKEIEENVYAIDYAESTAGWVAAFKETCWKLDMMWLAEYWDSLEWFDSDLFDTEIGERVIWQFKNEEGYGGSSYYKYLVGSEKTGMRDIKEKKS